MKKYRKPPHPTYPKTKILVVHRGQVISLHSFKRDMERTVLSLSLMRGEVKSKICMARHLHYREQQKRDTLMSRSQYQGREDIRLCRRNILPSASFRKLSNWLRRIHGNPFSLLLHVLPSSFSWALCHPQLPSPPGQVYCSCGWLMISVFWDVAVFCGTFNEYVYIIKERYFKSWQRR